MILPDGWEAMTDQALVDSLVEAGAYDREEARAVVELARTDAPVD